RLHLPAAQHIKLRHNRHIALPRLDTQLRDLLPVARRDVDERQTRIRGPRQNERRLRLVAAVHPILARPAHARVPLRAQMRAEEEVGQDRRGQRAGVLVALREAAEGASREAADVVAELEELPELRGEVGAVAVDGVGDVCALQVDYCDCGQYARGDVLVQPGCEVCAPGFGGGEAGAREVFGLQVFGGEGDGVVCFCAVGGGGEGIVEDEAGAGEGEGGAEVRGREHVGEVCCDAGADCGCVGGVAQDDARLDEGGAGGDGEAEAVEDGVADVADAADAGVAGEY
ncbi:hypothetical protein V498_10211, partial [Pseudogymnoascus sp. VKM F-4517 (FW-2822)]